MIFPDPENEKSTLLIVRVLKELKNSSSEITREIKNYEIYSKQSISHLSIKINGLI